MEEDEPQQAPPQRQRRSRRGRKPRSKRNEDSYSSSSDEGFDEPEIITKSKAQTPELADFSCPKFFEKTDRGCEKPLSLWRGNGQR